MSKHDLQNALDRTKIALIQSPNAAFICTIVFSLKHIWDDTQPTAYVDGVHMGWNPDFFMKMPPDERLGVMCHEGWHIAYDHIGRINVGKQRDPDRWNRAADHVINLMLLAAGFKLPAIRLADDRFKGKSTEEVYNILEAEEQNQPSMKVPGGMSDLVIKDPGASSSKDKGPGTGMTESQLQQHIQNIIIRAAVQSRMAGDKPGTIPGEVQLYLDNLLNPKLPWQTLLRRFFTEFSKNDYSWKRPNRRFFPTHHLPSLYSITLQDMTFYVDISGSVEDFQFKIFVSEIASVLRHLKPKKITIVQFDTRIHHEDTVTSLQELSKVEFHGRGGTHIECILRHMEANKNSLSIVFTDGHFHWPRDSFRHKILWMINDNERFKPRYGNAIHFSTKEYNE